MDQEVMRMSNDILDSVHVRLTDQEKKALDAIGERTGAPISWHMREAFRQYAKKFGFNILPAVVQRGRKEV